MIDHVFYKICFQFCQFSMDADGTVQEHKEASYLFEQGIIKHLISIVLFPIGLVVL